MHAGPTAGIEDLEPAVVIHCEDGHGSGKSSDPLRDLSLLVFPSGRRRVFFGGAGEHLAVETRFADESAEEACANIHPRKLPFGIAADGEAPESAIEKVVERAADNRAVLNSDGRHVEPRNGESQIDTRNAGAFDGGRHLAIADAREDAVSLPVAEPA